MEERFQLWQGRTRNNVGRSSLIPVEGEGSEELVEGPRVNIGSREFSST